MFRFALFILVSHVLYGEIVGDSGGTENCQLQRASPETTVGVGLIRKSWKAIAKQCSNSAQVDVAACVGTCLSSTRFNLAKREFYDTSCGCCRPLTWTSVTVSMPCNDGTTYNEEIRVPATCGCSDCDKNPNGQKSNAEADTQV